MSVLDRAARYAAEGPVAVFVNKASDARDLGSRPRWAPYCGAMSQKDREKAVRRFNANQLDGIAMTYTAGSMGFRLRSAKVLVFIDPPADQALLAQCAARVSEKCKEVIL